MKVSAVSYYNTRPFIYGLGRSVLAPDLQISLDIPSEGARKLRDGEVSLGLVPVGILDQVPDARIVSDWCIGCDGPVRTVCLYAQQPISQLDSIWLDYHSVTSVRLLRLLLEEYWGMDPQLLSAKPGFREKISGTTGGLVIGDRAIGLEERFPYVYDLGQVWKDFTGLPFVFAVWVSTEDLPPIFLREFNASLAFGVHHVKEVATQSALEVPIDFNLLSYYEEAISYPLDALKRQALERFLAAIGHRPARWATQDQKSEFPAPR